MPAATVLSLDPPVADVVPSQPPVPDTQLAVAPVEAFPVEPRLTQVTDAPATTDVTR